MKYSKIFLEAVKAGSDALRSAAYSVANEMETKSYDDGIAEILASQIEANHQQADILQGFVDRNTPKEIKP